LGHTLIDWAIGTDGAPILGAISFLLTAVGIPLAIWGLRLTYLQATLARESSDEAASRIEKFSAKRDRSEAIQHLSISLQSMEVASVLIDADKWKDAGSAYDQARRSVQAVRSMSVDIDAKSDRQLSLIANHLRAFSDSVDNAEAGKENYPDKAKVRSAIRKNCDDINHLQRSLHEGLT